MGVRVVTDSSCDLSDELIAEYDIEIVPLTIRFGSEEFVDRTELSNADFWRRMAASPVLPETAAPSAGAFEAAFQSLAESGATGIVCINLSSKLSSTMQSAQIAAKAFSPDCPVEVIDSLSVSMGLGRLCMAASELAADGADLDAIVAEVIDQRGRTKLFGALDTLDNLRKGGRIGNARALLGSMLSIKPIIEIRDGTVEEAAKVRTRSKAMRALVDKVKEGPVEKLSVLQGDAPDVDELLELLEPVVARSEIVVGQIGPVIGTHGGPRVLGVTFQQPHA
jgi:DegV family protein with EDD domain